MKEIVHFAHGNGFPSSCYRQLMQALETRYTCHYIDKIGHNPHFPVNENWSLLVKELIANVRALDTKPVIGIGHSLGGALTLLAAIEQPSLFKAVVMIDSPLLNRFKSTVVYLAKRFGYIDRLTPAHRVRERRQSWDKKEAISVYLREKSLFKTFSDACLQDYIDYGFEYRDKAYHLRFDRDVEYSIYRTLPHNTPNFEGKLQTPTVLIYGNRSNVVSRFDADYMKKKYGIESYCIEGTHMIPMEHPQQLALQIFCALDAIIS